MTMPKGLDRLQAATVGHLRSHKGQ